MDREQIRTLSGKTISNLTLDGVEHGELKLDDFRISPGSLILQAQKAEAAGYVELGLNLRRASELTGLHSREIFDIYETLRLGRTTKARLMELADHLEKERNAPLNASLVREAANAYFERGLIQSE
jgi:propanediol dehydratase small subunit